MMSRPVKRRLPRGMSPVAEIVASPVIEIVGSQVPLVAPAWANNFTTENTANLRAAIQGVIAGTRNAKIMCFGDSLTAGQGSDGLTNIGLRSLSYPAKLCDKLASRYGIVGNFDNMFGSTEATSTTYPQYDPKVAMGGATFSSTLISAGGHVMTATNNTATPTFTPTLQFDRADYYFVNRAGAVDFSGDSEKFTIASGTSGALSQGTFDFSALRDVITVQAEAAAGFSWIGVQTWNSAISQLIVQNAGYRGSQIGSWTPNPSPSAYDPYKVINAVSADGLIMNLGTNDYANQTLANYQTQIARIITQVKDSDTDLIILIPNPYACSDTDGSDGTGHATNATMLSFMDAMRDAAVNANIPYIDTTLMPNFDTYQHAKAAGIMYDVTHPNGTGYAEQADCIDQALAYALAA